MPKYPHTITPSDKMTRPHGRTARRRAGAIVALLAVVLATALCFPGTALADDSRVVYTDDIWSIWDKETPAVEPEASGVSDPVPDGPTPSEQQQAAVPVVSAPSEVVSDASDTTTAVSPFKQLPEDSTATETKAGEASAEGAEPEGQDKGEAIVADDAIIANPLVDKEDSTSTDSAATVSNTVAGQKGAAGTEAQASDAPYDAASVLVRMAPGTTYDQLNTVIARAGEQGLSLTADEVSATDLSFGTVRLGLCNGNVSDAITMLSSIDGVLAVQPNFLYGVEGTEGSVIDGEAQQQAAAQDASGGAGSASAFTKVNDRLTNTNWVADAVHEREAWDLVKTDGSVAVAVIDTGADLDHPDLVDRIVASYNSYDPSATAEDDMGHGTHVAGIVAGTANNDVGLAGSSYNANLVIIKASTTGMNKFETSSIVRAYAWLLEKGADGLTNAQRLGVRVINMSVGGNDDTITANQPDDEIAHAMAMARAAGILTVCAAGNKGVSSEPYLAYPGDSDDCLSVMNLKKTDDGYDLNETSNYNVAGTTYKDVCAPGTEIYSTWKDGKYVVLSGTSMAAPLVSGIAALMFAANPVLTPDVVTALIEDSCVDLGDAGWDERYGYGMVDAQAAVLRVVSDYIVGPSELGVGDDCSHAFGIKTSAGADDDADWTWTASPDADSEYGTGSAVVDATGRVTGVLAGGVIVRATKTAANGAEVSVVRHLRILEAAISGADTLAVGEQATYTVDESDGGTTAADVESTDTDATATGSLADAVYSAWRWLVDEGAGYLDVFANGTVIARKVGTYTLRAISSINSKLSFTKQLVVA